MRNFENLTTEQVMELTRRGFVAKEEYTLCTYHIPCTEMLFRNALVYRAGSISNNHAVIITAVVNSTGLDDAPHTYVRFVEHQFQEPGYEEIDGEYMRARGLEINQFFNEYLPKNCR